MERETELTLFKTDISLPHLAAGEFGYRVLTRKTSRHSVYIVNAATGSKISIYRNASSHDWIYKSYSDPADCGNVITFIQKRTGENPGQVRRRLRPWVLGSARLAFSGSQDIPKSVEPISSIFDTLAMPAWCYVSAKSIADRLCDL